MANFQTDQAEGLRRLLAGQKPRIFSFLSTVRGDEKAAMFANFCASLARTGSDVVLLDAGLDADGVAHRLGMTGPTLVDSIDTGSMPHAAPTTLDQNFSVAVLGHAMPDAASVSELEDAIRSLAMQADVMIADCGLAVERALSIPLLSASDIVIQLTSSAESITAAYSVIKRLNARLGKRPFSILVTGASDAEAKKVFDNLAKTASRYLAVPLQFIGAVPADEHLLRAAGLGRTVIDAFPLAGASVAFRRLAQRFALHDSSQPAA